jgi:hypothetical protein
MQGKEVLCTRIREDLFNSSSTGSMIMDLGILSISTLNFYLYIGFSLYGHCLIGLASDLSGIFISPSSPAIPFISVNVVGKRLLYSHSNYVMLSTICSSQ